MVLRLAPRSRDARALVEVDPQPGFPPCPACAATEVVPITYGYPDLELGQAEERGEIVLGGCLVGPESPEYECRNCCAPLPWTSVLS
jgi:hypothetical protein